MTQLSRRRFLHTAAAASFMGATRGADPSTNPIGFGTYGLPGYSIGQAIELVSAVGFDSIEIAAMPGYHGAPDQVSAEDRKFIRQLLMEKGLILGALMGLPKPDAANQKENDSWVAQTIELALELSPERPPLIQSVLYGGDWEEKKALFRDTLGHWVAMAAEAGVTVAIKPHRGHAMSLPEQGIWLIEELGATDSLKLVYDQSHFAYRDLPISETVSRALPYTGYMAIKDAYVLGGKVRFDLPGERESMPHVEVLTHFLEGGYRGEICCEVSAHVWRKEGYQPDFATRRSFANLQKIMTEVRQRR
ncbi:MAG: TIM barrel protein [Verrucomicrobiota bacterium]